MSNQMLKNIYCLYEDKNHFGVIYTLTTFFICV